MESANSIKKCLNCKHPTQQALCHACQETMKKAQDSAPKALFPYLLPKEPVPAPAPGLVIPTPVKQTILEVRPRCMADEDPVAKKRCAMPSSNHFCHKHFMDIIQDKNDALDQLANMEANNQSLYERKNQEIKELKAKLKAAETCDECHKSTPEMLRLCLDCYPDYIKTDLADDYEFREMIMRDFLEAHHKSQEKEIEKLKKDKEELQTRLEKAQASYHKVLSTLRKNDKSVQEMERELTNSEELLQTERQRNTMLCDTIRTQGIRVLDLERSLEKMSRRQRKGKRELQQLQEGVRNIWTQESKRPKRA